VDDSLILVTSRKDGDAELFAVLLERLELRRDTGSLTGVEIGSVGTL